MKTAISPNNTSSHNKPKEAPGKLTPCTKDFHAEHSRFTDKDSACDDSRAEHSDPENKQ